MADAVTSTTLSDSDRSVVIQLTNTSDGSGEAAVNKVDVSGLATRSTDSATCTGVRLAKIVYSTFGMSVKLLWDATTNVPLLNLPQDWEDTIDFSDFGIPNNSGAGSTGDILVTTVGATAGDTYLLVITVTKSYASA